MNIQIPRTDRFFLACTPEGVPVPLAQSRLNALDYHAVVGVEAVIKQMTGYGVVRYWRTFEATRWEWVDDDADAWVFTSPTGTVDFRQELP